MKLETLEQWVRKDRKHLRQILWRFEDLDVLLDFLWVLFFVPMAERLRRLEQQPPRVPLPPGGPSCLDEIVYLAIVEAIERTGSRRGAARELKVDEATIRNRLKKWERMGRVRAGAMPEPPNGEPGRSPGVNAAGATGG